MRHLIKTYFPRRKDTNPEIVRSTFQRSGSRRCMDWAIAFYTGQEPDPETTTKKANHAIHGYRRLVRTCSSLCAVHFPYYLCTILCPVVPLLSPTEGRVLFEQTVSVPGGVFCLNKQFGPGLYPGTSPPVFLEW